MKKKNVLAKLTDAQIKKLSIEKCYEYYISYDEETKEKIQTRVFHLLKTFSLSECGKYYNSFGDFIKHNISERVKEIGRETRKKLLPKKYLLRQEGIGGVISEEEEE